MLSSVHLARRRGSRDLVTSRRSVRRLLERVAQRAGVLAHFENRMRRGLTVLMYHRVLAGEEARNYPLPGLVMPEHAFRRQMEFLASRFEVVPVGEALDRLEARGRRARLVAVTFDDGYLDNYEVAAPILDGLGLRATFFVTIGMGALLFVVPTMRLALVQMAFSSQV